MRCDAMRCFDFYFSGGSMSATMLPLDQIGYDPEYYPRVNGKEDWLTVHRYKEAIKAHPWKAKPKEAGAFPAVVVAKATGYDWPYILLDGLHRVRAFSAAGLESIAAIVEHLPKSFQLAGQIGASAAITSGFSNPRSPT
jgi:hypothetical protein